MPSIEEVDSDIEFDDPDDEPLAAAPPPPALKAKPKPTPTPAPKAASQSQTSRVNPTVYGAPPFTIPTTYKGPHNLPTTEPEVYKEWTTLYPLYIDSKQPNRPGARRVSNKLALAWPRAEQMATVCGNLGFRTVYEPDRTHPKDWANPGRVKVLLKVDGVPVNSSFKDKRILLNRLCTVLAPLQPKDKLPPIDQRYPISSPAISHGILENALNTGGMGGMG
ncbi:signal recognition particle subunit SRP19, partial [Phenoliferia sp. Uapishka_3]